MLGIGPSLTIAAIAAALAFGSFWRALWLSGPTAVSRIALTTAGVGWAIVLGVWLVRHRNMTSEEHKGGMYRALGVWALTDIAVVIAFAV
jgi:hypothetical protein